MSNLANKQINAILSAYGKQVSKQALIALQQYNFVGVAPKNNAPQTFDELQTYWNSEERFQPASLFPVWNGASEQTIFNNAHENYLFRAWHDIGHMVLHAPFDLQGEKQVSAWQQSFLEEPYKAIMQADIVAQTQYYYNTGTFPVDQRAFVINQVFKQF